LTALEWSGSTSDGITPEPYDPNPVLSHVKWRYSMRANVLLVTIPGVEQQAKFNHLDHVLEIPQSVLLLRTATAASLRHRPSWYIFTYNNIQAEMCKIKMIRYLNTVSGLVQ
jgi:hypothetical protein